MSASDNYQTLDVGAGERVVDGKTHWTDFIAVQIADREAAFELAMDILRQYGHRRSGSELPPIRFNLTGVLSPEEIEEDD